MVVLAQRALGKLAKARSRDRTLQGGRSKFYDWTSNLALFTSSGWWMTRTGKIKQLIFSRFFLPHPPPTPKLRWAGNLLLKERERVKDTSSLLLQEKG